ncbi:MAG TPA: hypothetical protein VE378_00405 [Nitrososphaeraceae archaeon]|nr:hypothetical protein [Nitrososphaeraceae archaeon]
MKNNPEFLNRAKRNDGTQWAQHSLKASLDFHKERVMCKELAAGTLKNYYRAAKLFCEMNDLTLKRGYQEQKIHQMIGLLQ